MGIEVVVGLAVLSTMVSGAQTYASTKNANDQRKEQKKQLALQRKVELVKARREARIKAAQFNAATSASGVSGSVTEGFEAGAQTSIMAGQEQADQQYSLQANQFDIAADTTKQNAFFDFGQTAVSSGAMVFNSMPAGTPPPTEAPVGTYFLKP